ncbi:TVP38/TMEM64 family protein [Asticcacaulis excentricus]|uniref:TVP38/TMEM64 family membrane protein n=1 Tax=Asticcacaulis excentricus TaxID=78587 RepID=A0A3G9FXH4_9CAUL|nr:TVP38/TMEM64 family protein [Asticcacaulis excentricus]BBF79750.1 phospholipase D [Asticcacaulis excentricus]
MTETPDPSKPGRDAANSPLPLWRRCCQFLFEMDAKTVRAIWVTLALFAMIGVVFLIGKTDFGHEVTHEFELWMAEYRDSPWGIFIVIAVFTLSAYIGAPQFVLIAACVVAFGPWLGFFYSWVATVVSGAITFYTGRIIGADTFNRIGGGHLGRLSDYIGRNAFSASFIVRNVPSAPFIIVNMAFGVSKAPFTGFILGLALGSIPKTALVALFGNVFTRIVEGDEWKGTALIALIGLAWLGVVILARHLITKWREGRSAAGETDQNQ